MLGFFTFVAFVVAWNAGGWWWLIAIVMSLVWGGRQQEKKKAEAVDQPVVAPNTGGTATPVALEVDAGKQAEQLGNANTWIIQVTEICARYSGADYYVAELIPQKKLESAMKSYPVPGGGKVIALVDSTVMGSADNGMAIGEYGISWHNDWATDSKRTSFQWEEMKNISIEKDGLFDIKIGDGNKFNMSGCQFGKDQLVRLLREIKTLSASANTSAPAPCSPPSTATKPAVVDVNLADFDQLISLPGIGAAEAKMILDRRASQPFDAVDDLADCLDLKPHKTEQLRYLIVFSQECSRPPSAKQSSSSLHENAPMPPYVSAPPAPAPSQPGTGGRVID